MEWIEDVDGALVKAFTVTGQTYAGRLSTLGTHNGDDSPEDEWVRVSNERNGKIAYVNLHHTSGISVLEE